MTVVEVMAWPAMASRRTVLGSSRMAWVIFPAAMNGPRSCGIRQVSASAAVWLGNGGAPAGVMLTGGMTGGPLIRGLAMTSETAIKLALDAPPAEAGANPALTVASGETDAPGPG